MWHLVNKYDGFHEISDDDAEERERDGVSLLYFMYNIMCVYDILKSNKINPVVW